MLLKVGLALFSSSSGEIRMQGMDLAAAMFATTRQWLDLVLP